MATNTEDSEEYVESPDDETDFEIDLEEDKREVHRLAGNIGLTRFHLLDYAEQAAQNSELEGNSFSLSEYMDVLEKRTNQAHNINEVEDILTESTQYSDLLEEEDSDSVYFSYEGRI